MPDLEQGAANPYDHDNSVLRPPLSAMSRPRKIRTAGPELGSYRHALPGWAGGSGSRAKRGWREDPERRPGRREGKTVGRLPDQGHDQGHRQLLRPKRAGGQVCEAGGLSRGPGTRDVKGGVKASACSPAVPAIVFAARSTAAPAWWLERRAFLAAGPGPRRKASAS